MSDEEKRVRIIIEGQDDGATATLNNVGGGLSGIMQIAGGILTSQVLTQLWGQITGARCLGFGPARNDPSGMGEIPGEERP